MQRRLYHELGHGLGLNHPDRTDKLENVYLTCPEPVMDDDDNFMRQTEYTDGLDFHLTQIDKVINIIDGSRGLEIIDNAKYNEPFL